MKTDEIKQVADRWARMPEDSQAFTQRNTAAMGQLFPPLNSIMVRGYVPLRADYRCKEHTKN